MQSLTVKKIKSVAGWVLLNMVLFCPALIRAQSSWELSLKSEYNQNGRITRQYWIDSTGEYRQPDDKNYAVIQFTWNGRDRLTRTEYLDLTLVSLS